MDEAVPEQPTETPPVPTRAEVTATLTAPGQPFEMEDLTIRGIPTRTWKTAPATLRTVLELSALHGDQDFLVYEDERITFAEHFRTVAALAHAMVEQFGIVKGDRVAIAMRNLPEWVMAFWASISVGAVVVPLNAWWTGPELAYGLSDSGAAVAFVDEERQQPDRPPPRRDPRPAGHGGVLRGARPGRRPTGGRGLHRGAHRRDPLPVVPFADLVAVTRRRGHPPRGGHRPRRRRHHLLHLGHHRSAQGGGRHPPQQRLQPDEPVLRVHGGHPAPWPVVGRVGSGTQNANLLSVPLFHATGCHALLVTNTAAGGKLVMMHHFDPERALELIERERITIFGGVPAMVMQVIDSPNFAKRDTSSVQSISYGGAPCPPDLVRRIKQHFPAGAPGNGYGLTETSAMTTMNAGDDYVRKPDSVGPPAPVCDVAVVPEEYTGLRAARRPGSRPRADRRAVDQGPQRGARLLEPARGHRGHLHPGLAAHRRRGPHRRGGVRPHRGPGQGHDHPGRRERLLRRGGGGPVRAPGRGRLRRHRRAPSGAGRGGRGGRGAAARAGRGRRRAGPLREGATGRLQRAVPVLVPGRGAAPQPGRQGAEAPAAHRAARPTARSDQLPG